MKIGFYDSGLGGIKTLKDIIDMGLNEEIYFLGDEKNKPYGTKTVEFVKKVAKENVKKLIDIGCKIIVIACNTATSVAIKDLRKEFYNIEIIGTEPAVKLAIDDRTDKKILIMATTITIHGEKLHNLIEKLHAGNKIEFLAADELVKLTEDRFFNQNQDKVNEYLRSVLNSNNLSEFSHIILGCTHFPIAKKNIEEITYKYNIKVVDGNEGIGKNLLKKIKEKNEPKDEFKLHILTTAENEDFKIRTREILKEVEFDYTVIDM